MNSHPENKITGAKNAADGHPSNAPIVGGQSVGRTIPHDSAVGHVTGSAPYIEDLPRRQDELFVGFVGSPVACGTIHSIDVETARAMPGVACVFTAAEVGPHNEFGPLFADEPFLADKNLLYVGQPVVLIAADSPEILAAAQSAVMIKATAMNVT